jgi:hypothetical protein
MIQAVVRQTLLMRAKLGDENVVDIRANITNKQVEQLFLTNSCPIMRTNPLMRNTRKPISSAYREPTFEGAIALGSD